MLVLIMQTVRFHRVVKYPGILAEHTLIANNAIISVVIPYKIDLEISIILKIILRIILQII
jgi:hypothetical protein